MAPQGFTNAGSITVTRDLNGWEVRQEVSTDTTRVAHYTDWHRVELALRLLELDPTASLLRSNAASGRQPIDS